MNKVFTFADYQQEVNNYTNSKNINNKDW